MVIILFTETQTSGLQLKTAFLNVLKYSKYSDIEISIVFNENVACSERKQKIIDFTSRQFSGQEFSG